MLLLKLLQMVITLEWDLVRMATRVFLKEIESTVVYSDWSAYKAETGDQGFGISSLDVVFLDYRYL